MLTTRVRYISEVCTATFAQNRFNRIQLRMLPSRWNPVPKITAATSAINSLLIPEGRSGRKGTKMADIANEIASEVKYPKISWRRFSFTMKGRNTPSAGYSGTPLAKKLGLKAGLKVCFINEPSGYAKTLGMTNTKWPAKELDFAQFFTKRAAELRKEFPVLVASIKPNGMIWISWPKKSSKVESDLDENVIRDIGLAAGIVDVKVCAVDETWSGLKFVKRLKDR